MILIQARSTSTRFPNKHLAPLAGSTVLDVLASRVRQVMPFAYIIPNSDPLKEALQARKIAYFEGPAEDVLKRYMLAMDRYDLPWCIRVTGDCPLISPQDLLWMANVCVTQKIDYGTNCEIAPTDGQEIEFISRRLMQKMHASVTDESDREHVTPWARRLMREGGSEFRFYHAPVQFAWNADRKVSIDTPVDLERVQGIMLDVNKKAEAMK